MTLTPKNSNSQDSLRLLFVANVDWFFISHRLELARAASDAGFEVHVAAAASGASVTIEEAGARFHPLPLSRSGVHPLREMTSLRSLIRLYRTLQPHLIHHVSIKPILYGSLAARLIPQAAVINALSGFGSMIEGRSKTRRGIVLRTYRALFASKRTHVIVQNEGHRKLLTEQGIAHTSRVHLIEGSGVDTTRFVPEPERRADPPIVVLVGRMLIDKGVREFVEAATLLRNSVRARFVLVGPANDENPSAISREELESWTREGSVEWWGPRDDIERVLPRASAFVSASYHEGLPKAMLEAAACGLPIIATDIAGHRGVVDESTGVMVPPRDAGALAAAIESLLSDPDRAMHLGRNARTRIQHRYTTESVVDQTMRLYARLLPESGHHAHQ